MKQINFLNSEEQANLRIVEHLNMQNLPQPIGNELLLHMASAFRMINGDAQDLVPEIKPLDQRKLLFDQLPSEYAHKVLIAEAQSQGISPRTAFRWNEKWLTDGFIEKAQYGIYKKVG